MQGLMQNVPLLISSLIRHADRHHGSVEIVSRRVEGDIHRYTYRELHGRAKQLANALDALGVKQGDRVGTLAWNGYRHMELYYAVAGKGAIVHTINPRLVPDQVAWIANHAEDTCLFFDLTFLPIIEKVAGQCKTIKHFVAMTDGAHMPESPTIKNLLCYEELLAKQSADYEWPTFDENLASSMCYTSGTTGHPKGVLYSHRSTMLHTLVAALPDTLSISSRDVVLPVVPMFHVNAWGIPYAGAMTGAKLVFPGPALDGKSVYELIEAEKVTLSAGVPTVWQGLLGYTEQHGLGFSTMRRTIVGGAALPPAMLRAFEEKYNVAALHAWGMTEMSPIGTTCALRAGHTDIGREELYAVKSKQGRSVFGVDMKIVDPDGKELPWDGKAFGDLYVRGPWIVREYFRGEGGNPLVNVFCLGIARASDIGSYPIGAVCYSVAMAACIGIAHPKWDERPLLVVVRKPGAQVTRDELLGFYEGRVAKWQTPDDIAFVDAIPMGPTGKMLKNKLREQFKAYKLPSA